MATASAFRASKLKNHTPGFPSATTYVRTFNSGKAESHGSAGIPRSRTPDIRKGTSPSQARPPNLSISSRAGICGRNFSASIGQCANNKSCQTCAITQRPVGIGHGRGSVCCRFATIKMILLHSTSSPCKYTLLSCWRIEFSGFESTKLSKRSASCNAKHRRSGKAA